MKKTCVIVGYITAILASLGLLIYIAQITWALGAMPTVPDVANVGTTTQTKLGNLLVNNLGTVTEVRSNLYCNALGQNCRSKNAVASGQIIKIGSSTTQLNVTTYKQEINVTFPQPFTATPTVLLTPTKRAIGYVASKGANSYDVNDCEFILATSTSRTGFSASAYIIQYYWNGNCSIPQTVDWIAIGN